MNTRLRQMGLIIKHKSRKLIANVILATTFILLSSASFAVQSNLQHNKADIKQNDLLKYVSVNSSIFNESLHSALISERKGVNFSLQPLIDSNLKSLNYAQSSGLRSKSSVISEVKKRYNGEVVKVSFNERKSSYSVRVLLPNGKVKNVEVSARN